MKKYNSFIKLIIIMFSVFLVTQKVMFGINFSLADLLLLPLIFALIYLKQFRIPKKPLIIFLYFSVWTICVSVFITSFIKGYQLIEEDIFVDYIKLFVCFSYLCVGINFANYKIWEKFLKYYSIASIAVSILGLSFTMGLMPVSFNLEDFYIGNRYRGITNDPNLFSVMQSIALVYYLFNNSMKKYSRYFAIAIIISGILMSGSKTGIISLISLFLYKYFSVYLFSKFNSKINTKNICKILYTSVFLFLLIFSFFSMENLIRESMPATNRIFVLFDNFDAGVTEDGSSREEVWKGALVVINDSPFFGTGTGAYLQVLERLTNYALLSHNTYLQIIAEWGMPLGISFFLFLFHVWIACFLKNMQNVRYILPICLIFFISSLGLSLNNTRLFWLVIGVLLAAFFGRNNLEVNDKYNQMK